MNIVTWNCNMAFRKKASLLLPLGPDLLILPECECPEKLGVFAEMPLYHRLWVGDNPHKGLGILSLSPGLTLRLHDCYDPACRYVVPIEVRGTLNFNLLAVWAMNDLRQPRQRYIGQVWLAINKYQHLLDGPALVAGDFNWNVRWDGERRLYGNLTQVVAFLASREMTSLYHHSFQEPFGQETRPTLHLHRKAERPYHVDYIFASTDLTRQLTALRVGQYMQWSAASDHMPLFASFLSAT